MKNIGVFCSDNSIFCVERLSNNKHGKMFLVSGGDDSFARRQPGQSSIQISVETFSQFQQKFQQEGFKSNQINLALPSRDIIFRSFVIPWMPKHEIKNVVDYEVDKYLPFDKNELRYVFHDIPFVQENTRKIRIVFIGIKKLSLSQYVERFKQIGLTIKLVEPADVSLIQALMSFGEISPTETTTIVKRYHDKGKLMIVDQGVPLFVREFSFSHADLDSGAASSRLVNEVRISLDYFTRQDQQLVCKNLILINSTMDAGIPAVLQDSLGLPVKTVNVGQIFPDNFVDNIEYLNAYGVGLKSPTGFSVDFNVFSEQDEARPDVVEMDSARRDMISNLATIVICIMAIIAGLMIPKFMNGSQEQKVAGLDNDLRGFETKTTAELESTNALLSARLTDLKNVRLKSEIAQILKSVPELLPDGVWLEDFSIFYKDNSENLSEVELNLFGFSYAENSSSQFSLVNKFLANLKRDERLKGRFKDVILNSANTEEKEGHSITAFRITCR